MTTQLFYTVYTDRPGYPVRFLNRQTCHTGWLVGPFSDLGAALRAFQGWAGPRVWRVYQPQAQWVVGSHFLIQQHRQSLAAWQRWQALSSEQPPAARKTDRGGE